MSKSTTESTLAPVPAESEIVAEETPVKVGRIRAAAQKTASFVKEHKTIVIATVGLGTLVAGSAYVGRKTASAEPEAAFTDAFDTNVTWDEPASEETDTTVA